MSEFTQKIKEAIALLKSDCNDEKVILELLSLVLNNEEGCGEFFKNRHYYKTCLSYSAGKGFLAIMRLIWDKMAPTANTDKFNHKMKSYLLSVARSILDKMGFNISINKINPKNYKQKTPLHYAAENGHIDVVQAILDKMGSKASIDKINPKDIDLYTPLHFAAEKNHMDVVRAILDKMGPNASIDKINPKDDAQITPLHFAGQNGRLDIVEVIWEKMGPNASIEDFNPKNSLQKTPLHCAAKKGSLEVVQAILDKMGPNASIDEINPKDNAMYTPLHYAAKNGRLDIVEVIWVKMGPNASIEDFNPKDSLQKTPMHCAAEKGSLEVVQAILSKMSPNAGIDEINPKDLQRNTPLHYAAESGSLEVVRAILGKMRPNAGIDEINPKNIHLNTPLHYAAENGSLEVVRAILEKLGSNASRDEINPKYLTETPLYKACQAQKIDVIHALLDNELIEVNQVGPRSLLTFLSADTPDCNRVRERLRQLGCFEVREMNRAPNARLVQDGQGIHASGVEKSIKRSLEKLRVGKDTSAVSASYKDFTKYCNLSNPAFVDDLRAIQVNTQNFSRNLIVKALSVTDDMSEQEKVKLEKRKLSLFNDAIAHRLRNMVLSSNSVDFVESFKERIGLVWGELNNPEYWHKFTDLKEIMNKEGEAFSRDNPSTEFKLALQKLRNILFIQLIETRYEYAAGVNTNSPTPSREDYLDALERSGPSCAGGTNNFIIECFSYRHQDIEVLAGQFTPDFTPDARLPIRIASKLYELILASVNTRTEIQTWVNSETKRLNIEGISIVNELLDRMAGVSEKVKKVLPEDEILREERIGEYFRTGSIPGHSRAIGSLLGFLKQTLRENQDIIGGLTLQPNQDRDDEEGALTQAFMHLERVLSNSQAGFLTQALTEARSQYYQGFFKDNPDEQKLNRFIKILKGNERIDIDERGLVQAALIERYGEFTGDNKNADKILTSEKLKQIKEADWYKSVLNRMVSESQTLAQNTSNTFAIPNHTEDLTKKLDEMLGLKLRAEVLGNKANIKTQTELEGASSSAILFSKNKASTNAQISIKSEPNDIRKLPTFKGKERA